MSQIETVCERQGRMLGKLDQRILVINSEDVTVELKDQTVTPKKDRLDLRPDLADLFSPSYVAA